jgi:hypothetical protein
MRTVYVFAMVFAASVSAQASNVFDTGNELLSMCGSSQGRPYCLGTAAGYSDMLQTMGETCADKNVTRGQAADVVIRFLRDHPEVRNRSAPSLARSALKEAFPCPKN